MLTDLLTAKSGISCLILSLLLLFALTAGAQDTVTPAQKQSGTTLKSDYLKNDSANRKKVSKNAITSKIEYSSTDSIRMDAKGQTVYMYNEADIKYENLHLQAGFVDINFKSNDMHASGIPDSTGKTVQDPQFAQGDQSFKAEKMHYNYKTQRGYIQTVFTKQDEGYLHASKIKKINDNVFYAKSGSYTTCDLEKNPHYEFRFGKAKVISGKKVITGPAFMAIAGVGTPLLVPFGYFPNKTGRRSGILIPTYGESSNKGFYLQNGGYYWAMSDYTDLTIVGDIYSRGSWAIKPVFTYKYRYHFNGIFNLSFAKTILGTQGSPDYSKTNDYKIFWVHNQDPKARPRSRFSANVNIASSTYNKNDLSGTTENYLSNQFQSSINYSTNWKDFYYLNLNFSHNQNTLAKTISFTFPQVTFSINQVYPFRKKVRTGKPAWYENINFKYNFDAANRYSTTDSTLFIPGWEKQLQNGARHQIPISATVTMLKFLNWTTGISITDRMYYSTIRKRYLTELDTAGNTVYTLKTDTVFGFENAFEGSFSTSLSTRIYGMYQLKKGPIIAFRHMITPSVTFSYLPEYGSSELGYWRYVDNDTNRINPQKYSIFEKGIYGGPSQYKAGLLSFALKNNLEMKVRNRKDTVTGTRKIMLIEDLTLRTSYDLAKDTLKWSKIVISGYTTIFKSLRVQYSSSWDMYARDSIGRRINKTEWATSGKLLRLDNTTWDLSLDYSLSSESVGKKKETNKGTPQERMDVIDYYDDYVDFDIPWSFSIRYNFHFTKDWVNSENRRVGNIVQTLNFSGQLNLTPKWKVTLTSGYDFVQKQLSYTRIDIHRDLHCWEMRFGWTPKGYQQSWEFSINVKAPLLQDLKLNKKKDFRTSF